MLRPPPGSERARVIGLLDAFRAAEPRARRPVRRGRRSGRLGPLEAGAPPRAPARARGRAARRARTPGGGRCRDPGAARDQRRRRAGDRPLGSGHARRARTGRGRETVSGPEPEREWVIRFLDDLRAAEAASAEVLAAWIAVCALDGLRGGLRVIAEREAAHAELLAERLG